MEEEPEPGIPEWVVTFGDMMSLLLTFFIMLVSMSEIKEDEQYQAMVESIREQFGHDMSQASLAPGEIRPRTAQNPSLSEMGRAKKKDTKSGGQD
ncbi:MAG: flagellar motor protein MotB, partial [Lacipirellulaceae bacterium]